MLTRARALALLLLVTLTGCGAGNSVVISEFVASNTSGFTDAEGDTSDWIELHNRGKVSVNLEGWCLTDNPRELSRWCFPEASLAAQEYLIVFASGKRAPEARGVFHASFRLKATEDYLALVDRSGRVAHEFAPYPDQKENVSFGLTNTGDKGFLAEPTPGAPNTSLRR